VSLFDRALRHLLLRSSVRTEVAQRVFAGNVRALMAQRQALLEREARQRAHERRQL
jgi:hypothetical protein